MTRFLAPLVAIALLMGCYTARAEKAPRKPPPAPKAAAPKDEVDDETRFYRYKLNNSLGVTMSQSYALVIASQFGFAASRTRPWYVGPEVNFSLFSPGSILAVMASAWYEMRVYGAPRLSIALGAAAGPAFTSQIPNTATTTVAYFLEGTIGQDIDDLVTIRGQFRPGMIGNYFAFQMNLNVSFRFL
jgi:hypothetical protein